jgi:hypothetical protein
MPRRAIADRFSACKLVIHPEKTRSVYCKHVNRRGDHPDIHFDFLGFQFRARKTLWVKPDRRIGRSGTGRFITAATSLSAIWPRCRTRASGADPSALALF